MQQFLAAFGYFTLGIALSVFRGFVLKKLWGWFMVPLGVVEIGIAMAIGISVIVSLLVQTTVPATKAEHKEQVMYSVAVPVLGLFIGWVTHFFL